MTREGPRPSLRSERCRTAPYLVTRRGRDASVGTRAVRQTLLLALFEAG